MTCLNQIPSFRTSLRVGLAYSSPASLKDCGGANAAAKLVAATAPVQIDAVEGSPLTSSVPALAFTNELAVGLIGALPPGVVCSRRGVISGTPAVDSAGTYTLIANAMGASGRLSSIPFNLVVTAA
jgi:hypothetical protein